MTRSHINPGKEKVTLKSLRNGNLVNDPVKTNEILLGIGK